jgi:hypothetical protein
MTYTVFTFSEKLTVRNCSNETDLWRKLEAGGVKKEHIWKVKIVRNQSKKSG